MAECCSRASLEQTAAAPRVASVARCQLESPNAINAMTQTARSAALQSKSVERLYASVEGNKFPFNKSVSTRVEISTKMVNRAYAPDKHRAFALERNTLASPLALVRRLCEQGALKSGCSSRRPQGHDEAFSFQVVSKIALQASCERALLSDGKNGWWCLCLYVLGGPGAVLLTHARMPVCIALSRVRWVAETILRHQK